ncbi:hypothetical protein McanMca71_003819 [Microsporum canis]|uniref:Uncharacterized protein n=1 Tax=Arthroderma otae (strain ATCC MYA-4605 / CBS 113480) TaxID=554155 RepID=C5FVA1_ARTOC|nr:uncharacterized protein MCYG_06654 [Microsporum canis CBS 113480]EEQ33835.1 predicted protein [Microsporum canis CBS 113480]
MGLLFGVAALLSLSIPTYAAPYDQKVINKPDNGDPRIFPEGSHGGLYLCSGAGFVGHCEYYTTAFGNCITITDQFPPGNGGVNGVNAAGSDRGSWCTLYAQSGCQGSELQIHYPGYDDLRKVNWRAKARSYNCAAE